MILTLRGAASRCTAFETQVARQLIPPLFGKSFDACAARRKLVNHSLFAARPAVGWVPFIAPLTKRTPDHSGNTSVKMSPHPPPDRMPEPPNFGTALFVY